jgi:hypothetical protein
MIKDHVEFEMKHKFFKNSTHFINVAFKQIRESRIECDLFTEDNLYVLAWALNNSDFFRRAGVDIPIDNLMWRVRTNDLTNELINKFSLVMSEIHSLYKGSTYIGKCKELRKQFPLVGQLNIYLVLADKGEYSEEYVRFLEETKADPGVYFLYDLNKELIYIGKSYHLGSRLASSTRERKAFYIQAIKTKSEADANVLEPYYIALDRPRLNRDIVPIDVPTFIIETDYEKGEMIPVFKNSEETFTPE